MPIPEQWVTSYDGLAQGTALAGSAIGEANAIRQVVAKQIAPLYAAMMRQANASQEDQDAAIAAAQAALYPLREQVQEFVVTIQALETATQGQLLPLLDQLLAGYVPPEPEPQPEP